MYYVCRMSHWVQNSVTSTWVAKKILCLSLRFRDDFHDWLEAVILNKVCDSDPAVRKENQNIKE